MVTRVVFGSDGGHDGGSNGGDWQCQVVVVATARSVVGGG